MDTRTVWFIGVIHCAPHAINKYIKQEGPTDSRYICVVFKLTSMYVTFAQP